MCDDAVHKKMRQYKPTHKKRGLYDVTQLYLKPSNAQKNKPAFFSKIQAFDGFIKMSDKYIIAKKECFVNVFL